jgi:hypothetical protein
VSAARPDRAVWHEAFTLPLVFLSVALLGGLRIDAAGRLAFAPPPLMALVLAVVLLAALVRSATLLPAALVHPRRSGLANASGVVIVATLLAASAQVIAALTPEAGLLALVFDVAWLVLFGNTIAARPDRPRLLASLLVMFGAAFVVKYVLLGALYAPDGGVAKRVVMALVEGVSLGSLGYQPPGPATGYVAFATVLLYLCGVYALPQPVWPADQAAPVVTATLVEDGGGRRPSLEAGISNGSDAPGVG